MDSKALGQFLMQPSTADVLNTPVRRGGILPVTEYPNRSEFDLTSGLTGALWNAITAPARAARGEISEDQQIPEAFNFAGSLTLGSLLAPRPTGSVGMGGGIQKSPLKGHDWTETAVSMKDVKPVHKYMGRGDWRSVNQMEPMEVSLPIRSMNASQPNVNPDFASYSGNNELPFVIKKGGEYFVQDGHHRLVKQAAEGSQTAKVRLIDLDGDTQTEFPLLGDLLYGNAKTGAAVPLATRALEAQQPQGIRAFQGSPHNYKAERLIEWPDGRTEYIEGMPDVLPDIPEGAKVLKDFPLGRVRLDKVGTGEGAQAYGYGAYAAEAEDVARSYKNAGIPSYQNHKIAEMAQSAYDDAVKAGATDAYAGARDILYAKYKDAVDPIEKRALQDAYNNITEISGPSGARTGHMYEVNIKADPQDFLDWDKPLYEQPGAASKFGYTPEDIKAYRDATHEMDSELLRQLFGNDVAKHIDMPPKPEGAPDLSARGAEILRGPAALPHYALKEKFPGVRYLDQMSRGAGEGSSNYVVFDDNLIEILRKYGLLGPVAGGGTLAGMLMGGQEGETY